MQARAFAAVAPGGPSLKAFQDVMPLWTKGGTLEIEVKEQGEKTFAFNVVRCRYAETYKAMAWARSATCCRATATAAPRSSPNTSARA